MPLRARSVTCLLLALAAPPLLAQRSADDLAQALQRKYDAIRDFSAEFSLVTTSGALKKLKTTERGTVWIKKPGKMRWEYRKPPEDKLVVMDGVDAYVYLPLDKQVHVSALGASDAPSPSSPLHFLAGRASLVRDFSPVIVAAPPELAGATTLKLTPKVRQADYEWLVVGVDPATLALRGLVFTDAHGSTQALVLSNLKENVGVPDARFTFKAPAGVEITRR